MEVKSIIPTHCTRLGKCTYCPIIKKLDEITCKISGNKYKPKYLPKNLSCELSDIEYLITCKECKKYYVGETGRVFSARIYEHKLLVNKPKDSRVTPVSTSPEKTTLLRICGFLYWNGAAPGTTHHQLPTEEGMNSGGCGILEQSIQ